MLANSEPQNKSTNEVPALTALGDPVAERLAETSVAETAGPSESAVESELARGKLSLEEQFELLKVKTRAKPSSDGEWWYGTCPAHDDRNPSFAMCLKQKQRQLVAICRAHCERHALLAALGVTEADLCERPKARVVARYDYKSLDETLLYQMVRYE